MTRLINLLMIMMLATWLAACGGGGGSAGTPSGSANPSNFRVNAPADAALAIGQRVSYTISGGLAPYQINNSAPNVVGAVIVGSSVEITPLRTGTATLAISPSGTSVSQSILVTVSSSANPLQVQAPDSVVLRLGNTASYVLLGGVAPYRAESSAPGVLTATAVGDRLQVTANGVGTATVAVYDASTSAPVQRTITVVTAAAFFTTAPSAVTMGVGTQRTFTVSGGVAQYFVSSSNSSVADASLSGGTLTVVAGATNGNANILLRDSGGSSITIAVTVGTNVPFFTDAPDALTIQAGSPRTFTLGGGSKPYRVSSSNLGVATAALSGDSGFTLTAVGRGTATVQLRDGVGASLILTVTVEQGSAVAVSGIELTTNLASIRSAGEEAVITALVKGASNVGVPNADITFSSDSGILLSPSVQTDAAGLATVRLAPGSNRTNRTITVTGRVGAVSQALPVAVVGTTITVTGSSALQVGGAASPYNLRALDSAGNPIAGVMLTPLSTLGNGLAPASVTTDLNGNGVLNYTPTRAGTDSLTVTGAGATSAALSISISAVGFDYVAPTPAVDTSFGVNLALANQPVFRVRLLINNVAAVGRTVTFNTTRGTLSAIAAVTDATGEASVTLNSSSAGPALVTAQVERQAGDPGTGTVLASVARNVRFTGVLPANVRLQINPGAIPPNSAGSSTNRTEVTATVVDASANPVAGRQVAFVINADPSNGSLSAGVATTDTNGIARVEYIAGQQSSPTDGVRITATVLPVNSDIGLISNATTLSVNGNALFITVAFGNTISNLNPTTYSKPFSVFVTDSTGLAVPNQAIALSVVPTRYQKGTMAWNGTVWVAVGSVVGPPAGCPNEDTNFNGVLDAGEDTNGNLTLTPGNVVIAAPGSVTTDSSGVASFNLLYGEQYAFWLDVNIEARATVAGTESRRIQPYSLGALSEDINQETVTPAGVVSPFGRANVCTDRN